MDLCLPCYGPGRTVSGDGCAWRLITDINHARSVTRQDVSHIAARTRSPSARRAAATPHGCPGPSTPTANARATRAPSPAAPPLANHRGRQAV
jgi:hypothetical protein